MVKIKQWLLRLFSQPDYGPVAETKFRCFRCGRESALTYQPGRLKSLAERGIDPTLVMQCDWCLAFNAIRVKKSW